MIETVIISLTMAFCGKIMTEERAAVLIDNSYLRKEVLDVYKGKQGRFRLDYVKFSNSLCRDIDASPWADAFLLPIKIELSKLSFGFNSSSEG